MSAGRVYVVDDDAAVRDALGMLFRAAGLQVETFASASAFLSGPRPEAAACLVLDIRMPGVSGTALHDELLAGGSTLPIIFITGHGDIPMAVAAIKKGAYDFVEKPLDDARLLEQVRLAMAQGTRAPAAAPDLGGLSEREREVLERVLDAKPSREIADELRISVKTVEFHRGRIMQKLGVRSAAELFRICFAR